jgi:uncharacterized membrane protein (GlpM family)
MLDSDRTAAKRQARIVLISGLVPVIPGMALIIWQVGFAEHPHNLAVACIVAVVAAALVVSAQLFVYRQRMRRAESLDSLSLPDSAAD